MKTRQINGIENIKKHLGIALFSIGIFATHSLAEIPTIAVIKSRDNMPYSTALNGFHKAFQNKSVSPRYVYFDLEGNKEKADGIIKKIDALKPDLVLTVGTLATEIAKENLKERPVLFCMVLNPVAENLVSSLNGSENNLTGASLDIPPLLQFKTFKMIFPNLKTIGVLYNSRESKALVEDARAAAEELGLRLIARTVDNESDIPRALEDLKKEQIGCLWSISDSVVFGSFKSIQFIILFSLHNGIPFVGLSSAFVKAGALLALSCDIEDNGYQAGQLALELFAGKKPREIPIAIPRNTFLSINLKAAEQIGIKIRQDVIAKAKEIF